MRCSNLLLAAAFGLMALPALAQTPAGANGITGAQPGNVIGTGSSLPRSNTASNIGASDTRSNIAPNLPSPALDENAAPAIS